MPNKPSTTINPGETFGLLTVLSEPSDRGSAFCKVRCSCPEQTIKDVRSYYLRTGKTRSCGCSKTKHGALVGGRASATYKSYKAMLARCRSESNPNYGQRGVQVCTRWYSFPNFLRDMGQRPEGMTLDRLDVFGNYSPDNCRWATDIEQRNNRTDSRYLTYRVGGRDYEGTHSEWCRELERRTGREWTVKTLRFILGQMTLEQLLSGLSPYRRSPDELTTEQRRRTIPMSDTYILQERLSRTGTLERAPSDMLTSREQAEDVWRALGCTEAEIQLFLDNPGLYRPKISKYQGQRDADIYEALDAEMKNWTLA